jgi:predicted nucleotidyltransferase
MVSGYVSSQSVEEFPPRPDFIPGAPDRYPGEFLRAIVGSRGFGMATANSDTDIMGVCIEPPEQVIGLIPFEQHQFQSQPSNEKAGPDDVGGTIYSLRKFMRLAIKGNPTVLTLFFVPPELRVYDGILADDFRAITPDVISKSVARPFLGYMTAQVDKMLGIRSAHTNRPELIEQFGFDVKFASHAVRLGLQGVEILSTGKLTLPMTQDARDVVMSIREGRWTQPEVIEYVKELTEQIRGLAETSPLRPTPDETRVNQFLIDAYQMQWSKGY